ncbi:MAG: biotin/lipoyl-binding protein, partial [Planctomycetaceae bacterium]
MDRQLGIVFDVTPPNPDDLTQINNIQSREQLLLNQNGVFFLSQIALWHSREMNAFAPILEITLARIIDENWVAQARELCLQRKAVVESYPSTFFRMLTVVVCALLAGVLVVWAIGTHYNQPLTGILSADITTVQAPADARLAEVHVRPGDEVFTGQPLLQLENTEISRKITGIMQQLQSTEQELLRLEAQAAIELEWRRRDVDADIARLRFTVADLPRAVDPRNSAARSRRITATPASASQPAAMPAAAITLQQARRSTAGQILFFDGRQPTATLTEPHHATPPVTPGSVPAEPVPAAAPPQVPAVHTPVQTVAAAVAAPAADDLSQTAEPPEAKPAPDNTHTL